MAFEIQAELRTIFGKKVKTLRQEGKIPAEVYGREADNLSIQIDEKSLRKVLSGAGSTNLIAISVDGQRPLMALARNIQYSPIKKSLLHVDFYTVIMTETVSVTIPLVIVGESKLVKDEGGTLVTGLNSLDIEALPADLPETVEVDISQLKSFSDSISVADLAIPAGVTIHSSLDSMVATIQPPRLAEELEALDEEIVETIIGEDTGIDESEDEA